MNALRMVALLVLAGLGLLFNLAFAGSLVQPDWALALLMAALLARVGSWPWVIPGVLAHDLAIFWSPLGIAPVAACAPFLLRRIDEQLGAALPQRLLLLLLMSLPMLWHGLGADQWLLTLLLSVPVWYGLVRIHGRSV